MVVWSSWPFYYIEMSLEKSISWAPLCTDTVDDFDFSCLFKKVFYADIFRDRNETMGLSCNSSSVGIDFLHSFMSGLPQPAC